MSTTKLARDTRTPDRVLSHYIIEKQLAERLRNAPKSTRLELYPEIYNELYRLVPDHPMLLRKTSAEEVNARVELQLRYLSGFLRRDMTVLEVGCGDCGLSFALAKGVNRVFGLEVSSVISEHQHGPDNFELVISNGTSIPVPDGSMDLVYSNQLMEHLHPDDAQEQLRNIYKALKPGGLYVCTTPHRVQGPTDVSQLFDDVAKGLHLKEYTYEELSSIFKETGFSSTVAYVEKSERYYRIPMWFARLFERITMILFGSKSYAVRQEWLCHRPFTVYYQGINIVGFKGV